MPTYSQPVFLDPTGRRWRNFKAWTSTIVLALAVGFAVSWGQITRPPDLAAPPSARPDLTGLRDPPTIGTGPLVRLVQVQRNLHTRAFAVDPITKRGLGMLASDDAAAVSGSAYAVQRYGYSQAAHKTISLTFDDGPTTAWTPKILDLLSRHRVPATFFVVGAEVVRHPDVVARAVREGHTVANHTMTHAKLTPAGIERELVLTDRIIRATTGSRTTLFRPPYAGEQPVSYDDARSLVEATRLGYLVSVQDFDPEDWKYGEPSTRPTRPIPLPPTTMDNITILLHDGGGDRAATVAYLERLIPWAKAHGYSFHSLPQVSPESAAGTASDRPTLWDRETYWFHRAMWTWPNSLLQVLFILAVVYVVVGGLINVVLAIARRVWHRRRFRNLAPARDGPPVSVVVPAYNEERVIGATLRALCRSQYRNLVEVIVVDDGSTDRTADVVEEIAAVDGRVRLLRQPNSGKAAALNHGFALAKAEIVATGDADTLFTPSTIGHLARHFSLDAGDRLGAVAGTVKVGNLRNVLTRWQALEYITQVGVDRGAQDLLHAMTVVPGACAAWRRDAVLSVGGYSAATLAEDCDLALELQRSGYLVTQDSVAECYTEAPESWRALTRQRYRWMYGNLQALRKHRSMLLRPRFGWLGMVALPSAVISILLPVVFLPFVYVMAALMIEQRGPRPLLIYAALFLVVHLLQAVVGILLTRERASHLLMVPLHRVIGEPLRAYLLYKSTLGALRGTGSSWNKLQRTGTVGIVRGVRTPT